MSSLLERCSHLKNIHDQCVLHLAPSAPPEESVLERRFWVPMSVSDISGLLATNDCCMHEPFQVRCTKVCFLGRNVFSLLKHSSHLKKLHDHCVATPYTLRTTRGDSLETLFLGPNGMFLTFQGC